MAAPALEPRHDDPFDRAEPWTEQDFLELPEDRRVELVDGRLVVSPYAGVPHQRLAVRLNQAMATVAPDGFEVLETLNVRVGTDRILIPDIVVITDPGLEDLVCDGADVAMVVEIVGPRDPPPERGVKPRLYAESGIPHYLHVVRTAEGPSATAFQLDDGRYISVAHAAPGERLRLGSPFPLEVDLATLATATRPPR